MDTHLKKLFMGGHVFSVMTAAPPSPFLEFGDWVVWNLESCTIKKNTTPGMARLNLPFIKFTNKKLTI